MSDIKTTLKEATQDLLSEEALKDIESAFNKSVEDKVKLHVEKALTEQDEDYSKKLEHLLQAIDADHTIKLTKVTEAIDAAHAEKLKQVVEKFNVALQAEAKSFKDQTINNISTYLEAYLDETIPEEEIKDAVKNKRAVAVLQQIRSILGVDAALAKESIREAVVDGKNQINEASKKLEAAIKEIAVLKDKLATKDAELTMEKKTTGLTPRKKGYIEKVMKGKSSQFITENIDYAINLFDKTEKERLQNIKDEAVNGAVTSKVDRPVIEESVISEDKKELHTLMNPYLSELSKY